MGRRFALLASALGYFAGYGIMSVARTDYLVLFGRIPDRRRHRHGLPVLAVLSGRNHAARTARNGGT
ncbi:hypothetical protein MTO96_018296 [Rhipicephalus appendiculatus]